MKKVEGYFKFRITPDKYTTETKGCIEVTIRDEGFIENLKMMVYQFDRIATQVNMEYAGKAEKEVSLFRAEFELENSGIYWYCFTFELEGKQVYVFKGREYLGEKEPGAYPNEYCWKLEVKDATLKEYPEWKGRMIYQIIPDRFAIGSNGIIPVKGRKIKNWKDRMPDWQPDSDGIYRNEYFYGGNLQGIKGKIAIYKRTWI